MEMKKRVVVAGAGASGISAARLLLRHGAEVIMYISDPEHKVDAEAEKVRILKALMEYNQVGVVIGELEEALVDTIELLVMSPGISMEQDFVELFRQKQIPIWGELELAYQFARGHLAAITGTNGKTTTTALVGEIFRLHTTNTYVVGNIGIPYCDVAHETREDSYTVAEVSSFQLESIVDFCPKVSAILNLTPDHLNRHHTMECYGETKKAIAKNQTQDMYCILNYDDPATRAMGQQVSATSVYFSRVEDLQEGVVLKDSTLCLRNQEQEIPVLTVEEMKLLGSHNVENYLAAIGICYYMGIPVETIRQGCMEFNGVEHRIEFVKEVNGVAYYNDSKGTNPDAAIKAVQAMNRKTLLIGGGYDKQVPFDDWILSFDGKVKCLALIGQTANVIADTARKYGFEQYIFCKDLKEAVLTCAELAEPGEAVLLSPACASWGQFANYEERGRMFKEYVHGLEQ